jgi:hypothetical protein
MGFKYTLALFFCCFAIISEAQTPFNGISVQEVPIDSSIDIATLIESTMPLVDGDGTPDNSARCWRVYICMNEQLWEARYFWGDNIFPWVLNTTTSFYQSAINGGFLANQIDPGLFSLEPASEYDSWFTIGETYNSTNFFMPGGINPINTWEYGSPLQNGFNANDILGSSVQGTWANGNSEAVPGAENKVLIAQFTTDGDWSATMNFYFRELSSTYVPTGGFQIVSGVTIDGTPGAEIDICPIMFLPVELLNFDARQQNGEVHLNWTTVSEINNDFFTIERSMNQVTWEEVETLPGSGTSYLTNHYASIDPKPYTGTSYYRLKQTDTNGDFSHSYVVSVEIKRDDYSIYPNPAQDQLSVRGPSDNVAYIQLRDATGKLVAHFDRQNYTMEIPLSQYNLKAGLYVIEIGSLYGEVQFEKLIIRP